MLVELVIEERHGFTWLGSNRRLWPIDQENLVIAQWFGIARQKSSAQWLVLRVERGDYRIGNLVRPIRDRVGQVDQNRRRIHLGSSARLDGRANNNIVQQHLPAFEAHVRMMGFVKGSQLVQA